MSVEKNINLARFMKSYSGTMGDAVATNIQNEAVRRVRVDEGTLKNSIRKEKTDYGYIVETGALDYALAQEYGLAKKGKPRYKFTPYMRPASKSIENTTTMHRLSDNALRVAISRSII